MHKGQTVSHPSVSPARPGASALYRAIWRWHFFAGLIVAPVLLVLSLTGGIYLFNDEIEDALTPGLRFVTSRAPAMPVSHLVMAAQGAHPGAVTRIEMPAAPDRPVVITIAPQKGDALAVPVEPGTARVMGAYDPDRTFTNTVRKIHGTLIMGKWGDHVVELVACWTLFLIASGLYMWWPRSTRADFGGIFFPRLWLKGRLLWRDLHVSVGVWTMLLIGFLILTGLPWAEIQGQVVRQGANALGIGYPAGKRPPQSVPLKDVVQQAPWTLAETPVPQSSEHAGHAGHGMVMAARDMSAEAGVDQVVAAAQARGLAGGYSLSLPRGPQGVYTVSTYPGQPQGQRTLFFDRYSGALIREVGYRDYGWAAKAIELGVQIHMGNYFGRLNQIVMLLPCIGIWLLVISGVTMWWKRRPSRKLAPPPRVPDAPVKGALALMALAGVVMPLFGASLLVILGLDRLLAARRAG